MYLTQNHLEELKDIAITAALSAGKIIGKYQGEEILVNHKQGGENLASQVVTEIDIAAQEAILEILNPTLEKYDLGLLTEESDDNNSRHKKDYFWCIDPLDGTLSFSRNEDGYSTSIALVSKQGVSVLGVVLNPRTNDIYHAIKENGAFKNNSPFKINNESNVITLLFDQSFLKHPLYEQDLNKLEKLASEKGLSGIRHFHLGGAVMNGISTIEHAPAIYYKHPKQALGGGSIWDFAASSIIQAEAGGYNSDYYHSELNLNQKDSTFMNKRGIIYCSSEELTKLLNRDSSDFSS